MKFSRRMMQLLTQKFFGLLVFGLCLSSPVLTSAAPSDLDITFGNGGKAITQISTNRNRAYSVAIQTDGKFVVAGNCIFNTTGSDFCTVRYNANGSLDTSFGVSGKVITPIGNNADDDAQAVLLQTDGKIIVAGTSSQNSGNGDFVVVRYNTNGTLDTTFGTNGIATASISNNSNNYGYVSSAALQSDGKIVLAGKIDNPSSFALMRFNSNGSVDTNFGTNGRVITTITTPFGNRGGGRSAIKIQPDSKIILAGSVPVDQNNNDDNFVIVRYNSNGTLDGTFGTNGQVLIPITTLSDYAKDIELQSDGKIIVAGHTDLNSDFALIRLNSNGSLDTTFGTNGKTITSFGTSTYDYSAAVAIQPNGKIVVVGETSTNSTSDDFAVARYNANGTLDTSFGTNGTLITPIRNGDDRARDVLIQPDGKIVVAGYSEDTTRPDAAEDFVVVRYLGDTVVLRRPLYDFDGDGKADQAVFRSGVWYLLRSQAGFTGTQFGASTDKITPADFDGDGKTDIAVFRDGFWYWLNSSNGNFNAVQFGQAGDVPVPADYTGDGRAEIAVYRGGFWYTLNLVNNQFQGAQFGNPTDKPVPADFDADGKTDFAVYRDGTWYLLRSLQGFAAVQFGNATDKPTVGDYDGDGKADQAVYRSGVWYVLGSTQGFYGVQFGAASDVPVAADYDGDGKTDIAVFRDGVWYMLRSQQGFGAVQFGTTNDRPIPAAFVP